MIDFNPVSLADYLAGWLWFGIIAGGAGFTAWRITAARLAWMALEARAVAAAVITVCALVASCLVPLALGLLSIGTVSVTSVALAVAATLVRPRIARDGERPQGTSSGRNAWLVAGGMALVGVAFVLGFERDAALRPVGDTDSTSTIIPTLLDWIRSGTMWEARDFVAEWAAGAFPNHGGMLQLTVLLPWHADFALRAIGPALLGLCALATYALACELRASRAIAAGAGLLGALLPTGAFSAVHNAQVDALCAFGIVAAALFVVRHVRTGRASELMLAALAGGLAFGTKWYGPPELAALLLVWVVATRSVRMPVLLGAGIAVVGGIWLVRNGILYGNPLFPAGLESLGIEAPPAFAGDVIDFPLAYYFDSPGLLADPILGQLILSFSLAGVLAVAGALATVVAARRLADRRAAVVAAGALAVLVIYTTLPYTGQGTEGDPSQVIAGTRYAVPGLLLALAATAAALARAPLPLRVAAAAAGIVVLAHELERLSSYPGFDVTGMGFVEGAFVAAFLAGGVVALRRWPIAVAAAALLLVVAGARIIQERYMEDRYRHDPAFAFLSSGRDGERIALAGITGRHESINVAAFGPRFDNDVRFLGPRKQGLLVRDTDRAAFQARLEAADADHLVVGFLAEGSFPEDDWARAAGWRPVVRTEGYVILAPPTD